MGRDMMRLRRGILLNTPHEEQASGAVASFATDIGKLKECVVEFDPVQDLHGYDNPWPPGGGKNLLNLYLERTNNLGVNFSLTQDGKMHLEGTNTSTTSSAFTGGNFSTYEACPWKFSAGTYMFSTTVPSSNAKIGSVVFSIRTKTDNTLRTFNAKSKAVTVTVDDDFGGWFWISVLKEKTVNIDVGLQLEKGSTATSWTPYENICPISGWSEANVYDDPKYDKTVWWNQAFLPASDWKAHSVQTRFSVSDGVITATLVLGSPSVYSPAIAIEGGIVVTSIANHKYYFACKFNPAADGYPYLRNNTAFSTAAVFGTKTTRAGEWGSYENIVSAPATGGPAWYLGNGGNTSQIQIGDSFSIKDLMCIDLTAIFGAGNEPSTVDEFKALFPNDYYAYNAGEETLVSAVNGDPYRAVTIDLDGTRYGGMLNVLTGVFTGDKEMVDLGQKTATMTNNGVRNGNQLIVLNVSGKAPGISNFSSDVFVISPSEVGRYTMHGRTLNSIVEFEIPMSAIGKAEDDPVSERLAAAKQWFITNAPQLCYDLATPFDVQLTPAQLRAIKGQNNIFADCGDVAVKYWKH